MDFNSIVNRSKNLITNTGDEWEVINSENKDYKRILLDYLLPVLIAVAASGFFGDLLFNSLFSMSYMIIKACISFMAPLVSTFFSAFLINEMTKSFNSEKGFNNAFGLVAYGSVPSFVVSIVVGLVPFLFFLGLLSFYSLFLIWKGLSPLMKTPPDKRLSYIILITLIILGVNLLISFSLGLLLIPFSVIPISL